MVSVHHPDKRLIPAILGHEGAGIVEEVGSEVRGVAVGDHVVLSWKRNRGQCEMCQRGYAAHQLEGKHTRCPLL